MARLTRSNLLRKYFRPICPTPEGLRTLRALVHRLRQIPVELRIDHLDVVPHPPTCDPLVQRAITLAYIRLLRRRPDIARETELSAELLHEVVVREAAMEQGIQGALRVVMKADREMALIDMTLKQMNQRVWQAVQGVRMDPALPLWRRDQIGALFQEAERLRTKGAQRAATSRKRNRKASQAKAAAKVNPAKASQVKAAARDADAGLGPDPMGSQGPGGPGGPGSWAGKK